MLWLKEWSKTTSNVIFSYALRVVRFRSKRQTVSDRPFDVRGKEKILIEKIYQVEVRRAQSEILHSPDGRIAKRKAELKKERKRDLWTLKFTLSCVWFILTKITMIMQCNNHYVWITRIVRVFTLASRFFQNDLLQRCFRNFPAFDTHFSSRGQNYY